MPGGHLEYMETLEHCCKREIKEETGLSISNLKFVTVREGLNPKDYYKKSIYFVYLYFTATAKNSKKIKLDKREGFDCMWISPVQSLKLKNLHPIIKKIIKKLI